MTQEALAEKLFITRQSVSSWENDRTQPDIEMLGKLSEIFDVSIEELIYGHKRNVTLETEKPNYNSTLMIVFSILGSLLAGVGLVLIFVTFWQKMPMLFKAVLSFLPLLAGQSAGVFVLLKKREKLPWCEGAAVLWTAGIAATLSMIYNIFDLEIYWYTVLIMISVCLIPVIMLLKAVSPLAVYYGCAVIWCIKSVLNSSGFLTVLFTLFLLAFGCMFTSRLVKKENKSIRSLYSHWVSVAAITSFVCCIYAMQGGFSVTLTGVGALGICLLLLCIRESDIIMPYRLPGLIMIEFMLFWGSIIFPGEIEPQSDAVFIIFAFMSVVITAVYLIFSKTKSKDIFFILFIVLSTISLAVSCVVLSCFDKLIFGLSLTHTYKLMMKVFTVLVNILLMISGAKEKKLLSINAGFVAVSAVTIGFVHQSGLSLAANGVLLVIFGAILLAINFRISRKNVKKDMVVINEEVADNDTES